MRASHYFMPTLREAPAEAELPSHRLLLRGGFIRKVAAGVYTYLPLGWRVIRKVEQIVREETDRIGGVELFMSSNLAGHDIYYLTDTLLRLLQDEASPAPDAPADASLPAEQVAAVWARLALLTPIAQS